MGYKDLPVNNTGTGITSLTGDVTATGPGATPATLTATTNATLTTLSALSLPSSQISGVLSPVHGGAPPVTRYLYVDVNRTDSYTADGSLARPFKTIQASINQIITNADNATHGYTVNVNPGAYAESLTFNNALLYNINFQAAGTTPSGQGGAVSLTGSPAISSTSNNTQLATLIFGGFSIGGGVTLTGDINNTNFGSTQILFNGCDFEIGTGNVTFTNVNNVSVYGGQFNGAGTVTFNNIAMGYIEGAEGFHSGSTLTLIQNNAGNQPSQSTGNYVLFSGTKCYSTASIDAGSELDSLLSYFGSGSSVTNNGTIHSWGTNWNGTLTLNNGSTTRVQGDVFLNAPTINAGATYTNRGIFAGASAILGATAVSATNTVLVAKDGHLKSTQTTAPTTTTNANAGTGASSSVSHATDVAGQLSLTSGSGSFSTGIQATVNFNKAYNVAPIVSLTPANAQAASDIAAHDIYVTSTVNGFSVNFGVAQNNAGVSYIWNYLLVETQ